MNYSIGKYVYVVVWDDMNNKTHQDEIVRPGLYEGERSWVHTWDNVDEGINYFLINLLKHNITVYRLTEYRLAKLRSEYIVIPSGELDIYCEEVILKTFTEIQE